MNTSKNMIDSELGFPDAEREFIQTLELHTVPRNGDPVIL